MLNKLRNQKIAKILKYYGKRDMDVIPILISTGKICRRQYDSTIYISGMMIGVKIGSQQ
jgi:hypothetical protein